MTAPSATNAARTVLACLASAAFAGCIGVADPMPSPEKPDETKVLVSASSALRQEGGPVDPIGIIGLPKAAPKAGLIVLRQVETATTTTVRASADGTFAAVLAGAAGDRILLSFQETADGPESDPVELDILRYDAAAAPGTPDTQPGINPTRDGTLHITAPEATPPDGAGRVHVTGAGLTPDEVAIIGNVRTGQVLEATVDKGGELDVTLAAASHDTIVVMIRDPATGLTSKVASLTVPAP